MRGQVVAGTGLVTSQVYALAFARVCPLFAFPRQDGASTVVPIVGSQSPSRRSTSGPSAASRHDVPHRAPPSRPPALGHNLLQQHGRHGIWPSYKQSLPARLERPRHHATHGLALVVRLLHFVRPGHDRDRHRCPRRQEPLRGRVGRPGLPVRPRLLHGGPGRRMGRLRPRRQRDAALPQRHARRQPEEVPRHGGARAVRPRQGRQDGVVPQRVRSPASAYIHIGSASAVP